MGAYGADGLDGVRPDRVLKMIFTELGESDFPNSKNELSQLMKRFHYRCLGFIHRSGVC
jgi:hypothetical protein